MYLAVFSWVDGRYNKYLGGKFRGEGDLMNFFLQKRIVLNIIFNWRNVGVSLACTLVVFGVNFLVPSYTNGLYPGINLSFENVWSNENSALAFSRRCSYSEFKRRPFVLEFQRLLSGKMGLPYQFSFNLINYISLFFVFLMLPNLVHAVNKNLENAVSVQLVFLLSMPVIFAFFVSIATHDDIVQYLFLILFLTFLFQRRHITAGIFFTMACICRETSFIYSIIIIAFFLIERFEKKLLFGIIWLLPLAGYYFFISQYLTRDLLEASKNFLIEERFLAWQNNFSSLKNFRESTTILLFMTSGYLYLLYIKYQKEKDTRIRKWCLVCIGFVLLNSLVVSISGLVREARLLFIPLVLVLPLVASEIRSAFNQLVNGSKKISLKHTLWVVGGSFLVSILWFSPKAVGTGYIYKAYSFIYFTILFELIYVQQGLRTKV